MLVNHLTRTGASTIFGGVILFVIGQLLSRFLIKPIQELKKAIGEVRFNLAFYAPTIHTPISRDKERSDKAYDAIMRNSCDLLTKADAIPFYRFLPRQFVLPIKHIDRAAVELRALTTYLHETQALQGNLMDKQGWHGLAWSTKPAEIGI